MAETISRVLTFPTAVLGLLASVIERNPSIPILKAVRVTDVDGKRVAQSTDLEKWVQVPVAEDIPPGLYEIVGKELVPSSLKEKDYPAFQAFDPQPGSITVDTARAARISLCMSVEESRYTLNGMALIVEGKDVTLVATDGHRLAVEGFTQSSVTPHGKHLLRSDVVRIATKHAAKKHFTVYVSKDKEWQKVELPAGFLLTRALTGTFPNYEAVVPREFVKQSSVDREKLVWALNQLLPYVKGNRARSISFRLKADRLILSATDENTTFTRMVEIAATVERPVTQAGFDGVKFSRTHGAMGVLMPMRTNQTQEEDDVLATGFHHTYLLEAAKSFEGERFYFGIKDGTSALSYSGARFTVDGAVSKPVASVTVRTPARIAAKRNPVVPVTVQEPYAYLRTAIAR